MNIRRKKGLEKEISRIISTAIIVDVKNEKIKKLISIQNVNLSNDAHYADIYLSIMLDSQKVNKEKIMEDMNKIKGFLRKKLSENLEIRYIPEIRFHLDDSIEYSVKIAKLLNDIKVKSED